MLKKSLFALILPFALLCGTPIAAADSPKPAKTATHAPSARPAKAKHKRPRHRHHKPRHKAHH